MESLCQGSVRGHHGMNAIPNRIAVIANQESHYARRVVDGLCRAGHPPACVFLGSRVQNILFKLASLRRIWGRLGVTEVYLRLRQRGTGAEHSAEPLSLSLAELETQYDFEIRRYDKINQGSLAVELLSIPSCVTVLAGCGIVDLSIILASRGGCVNGHPAWLPGLRGVDVYEWAILKEKHFGVTAHLVEERVDAGKIVRRAQLQPEPGESFAQFYQRLLKAQAEVLCAAAIDLSEATGLRIDNDLSHSELCFAMPNALKEQARKKYQQVFGKASIEADLS